MRQVEATAGWQDALLQGLERQGCAALPAGAWERPAEPGENEFLSSWNDLVLDTHMGDGGRYRYRRYSRFQWEAGIRRLSPVEGTSIFQSLEDNPLNGGVTRRFEPLTPVVLENRFLHALIRLHAEYLPLQERERWSVGVHCVRILASAANPGTSTPEGIHRDAERFTVQHLIARRHVRGGVFSAYNAQKQPWFHWLQLQTWDTLVFTGSLWHSATPVHNDGAEQGYRDILLIDFD